MNDNNEAYELAESAACYAGNLFNGLEKIVESLREDKIQEGLASLVQATEGIEWLFDAVAALNNIGGFSGFETEELGGFFGEMLEATKNQDHVFLADLIEYEIMPIIDQWGNKLDDLLESREN